jgi:putative transcriptional regulator
MAKKTLNIGAEILQGIREIKRGEYGRVINVPDVAATRAKNGLCQVRFAELLGVSVRTLQDGEQGRRRTLPRGVELPAPRRTAYWTEQFIQSRLGGYLDGLAGLPPGDRWTAGAALSSSDSSRHSTTQHGR